MRAVRAAVKKVLAMKARFKSPDHTVDTPNETRKKIRDLKKLTLAELKDCAEMEALRYAVFEDSQGRPPDSPEVFEEPIIDSTEDETNA